MSDLIDDKILNMQRSAERGDTAAQIALGYHYFFGNDIIPVNYKKAAELFRRATSNNNPKAYAWLGCCYAEGKGVQKDFAKAAKLFSKAAAAGDTWAQTMLATRYEEGKGVKANAKKAFDLLSKAAAKGDSWAQLRVGFCYEYGSGVAADFNKAADYYRQTLAEKTDMYVDSPRMLAQVALHQLTSLGLAKNNSQDDAEISIKLFEELEPEKLKARDLLTVAVTADLAKNYDTALKYYENCISAADFETTISGHTKDDTKLAVYYRKRGFTDYFRPIATSRPLHILRDPIIRLFVPSGAKGYSATEKQIIVDSLNKWLSVLNKHFYVIEVPDQYKANLYFKPVDKEIFAGKFSARTCYARFPIQFFKESLPKIDRHIIELPRRKITSEADMYNMTGLCLHEIGHAFGLRGHSIFADDIMFAGSHHQTKLSPRDIEAVNCLYRDDAEMYILSELENEVQANNPYAFPCLGFYQITQGKFKAGFNMMSKGKGYGLETAKEYKWGKFLIGIGSVVGSVKALLKRKRPC